MGVTCLFSEEISSAALAGERNSVFSELEGNIMGLEPRDFKYRTVMHPMCNKQLQGFAVAIDAQKGDDKVSNINRRDGYSVNYLQGSRFRKLCQGK